MSEDREWGPWQEHDGKGCPVVGCAEGGHHPDDDPQQDWEDVEDIINGHEAICIARPGPPWSWGPGWYPVIRYRVQKPKALRDLIELVENLPAPVAPARLPERVPA